MGQAGLHRACLFLNKSPMPYIDPSLQQQLSGSEGLKCKVLITLKDEAKLPDLLINKGHFVLQDKIFAASVTAADFDKLANDVAIDAIEPDGEMHIM